MPPAIDMLAIAMRFVEKSYAFRNYDALVQGLFEASDYLNLDCCLLIACGDENCWYSSEGSIKPLEKELIEMLDKGRRFVDFGARTIVNYHNFSLLIKNMPLDDMERCGRIKDLMPTLLSAACSKTGALDIEQGLAEQGQVLLKSFTRIRTNFYYLAKTLLDNRNQSTRMLRDMVSQLHYDLLRMGLEEDQEDYILSRIDSAIEEAVDQLDAGKAIQHTFSTVLSQVKDIIGKQEILVKAFTASPPVTPETVTEDGDSDIELF